MCTIISSGVNLGSSAGIPPEMLALELPVIQAETFPVIPAGVQTEIPSGLLSGIHPCISPEVCPAIPLRIAQRIH